MTKLEIMGTKFLRWIVNVAKSSLSPLFVARALQGEGSKIGCTVLILTSLFKYWERPTASKKTRHVPNTSDPEWNETLDEFYIDPKRDHLIEFVLYDLNRTVNEEIGREVFDF